MLRFAGAPWKRLIGKYFGSGATVMRCEAPALTTSLGGAGIVASHQEGLANECRPAAFDRHAARKPDPVALGQLVFGPLLA